MNKHTQGEWITKDGQIYPQETGKTIALIPYFDKDNEEQQANAKLIAAAPEMLKALIEIRTWYEENRSKYLREYTPICFSKGLSAINNVIY